MSLQHATARDLERGARRMAAPPPDWNVAQHAEARRKLSPETTALHGPYRFDVTPYWREPAEWVMRPDVERLKCVKGNQLGWSDFMNNVLLYIVDLIPGGVIMLFPTKDDGTDWHSEKFVPMIRDSGMADRINSRVSRDGQNTTNTNIRFAGGMITVVWSGSASKLSQRSRKYVIIEEPDKCLKDVKAEGNSLKLAVKRSDTFADRKIIMGGTPTVRGSSPILKEMETTDWRKYWIPCHLCGFYQYLEWESPEGVRQVKWDMAGGGDTQAVKHAVYGFSLPDTAYIECANCAGRINNDEKIAALADGHWVPTRAFNGELGYDISSIYSPMGKATLATGVKEYLAAKVEADRGDFNDMRVFVNTYRGEGYDPPASEEIKRENITHLREDLGTTVPMGVHYITCAVDPGGHRMDVEFVGWGEADESWGLLYVTLETGMLDEKDKPDMFETLEKLLFETEFQHASGIVLKPECYGVDTGAYATDMYGWIKKVKKEGHKFVYGLKGKEDMDRVAIHASKALLQQHNIWLYIVGTDPIKLTWLRRMQRLKPGPGYMHISNDYPDDWEAGMVSNRLYSRWKNGQESFFWKKDSWARDEPLDLRVYNSAIRYKDRNRLNELPKPGRPLNRFAPRDPGVESGTVTAGSAATRQPTGGFVEGVRATPNWFGR